MSEVEDAVLVIGGGIAGIQAALDLADAGVKVYLVERTPSVGGRMAQLDKTFPTNDCSICISSPKYVAAGRHPNIELLTYSELEKLEGDAPKFKATIKTRGRSVDLDKCTGCELCIENCPVALQPQVPEKRTEAPAVKDKEYLDGLIQQYETDKGTLIQIMLEANEHYRYLPRDVLAYISFAMDIPLSAIYRVATFYKSFSLELRGEYHIKVCLGTACHVRGARKIVDAIRVAISGHEEGLFSMETVNCLGACALGPIMMVNEEVHGQMTIDKVDSVISSLAGGENDG